MHAAHTMVVIIIVYCQPNAQGKLNKIKGKKPPRPSHVTLNSAYYSRYGNFSITGRSAWRTETANTWMNEDENELKKKKKEKNHSTRNILMGYLHAECWCSLYDITVNEQRFFFLVHLGLFRIELHGRHHNVYIRIYMCQIIIIVFLSLPLTKRIKEEINFAFVATETQF